ncbi:MAG: radical SAM protein [bacterium]|nr:radical SAM protein [bacterium]
MAGLRPKNFTSSDDFCQRSLARALRRVNELHFQVTSACNLSCRYCYAKAVQSKPGAEQLMDISVLRQGVDTIFSSSSSAAISVIFHGGEPLLLDPSFYAEACEYTTARATARGGKVSFGLQSNLTLISDEHLSIFREFGVSLGTSLDGPAHIHNQMRGDHAATMRGIEKARAAGLFSGPICVIGLHNYDRMAEVMEFLREIGVTSFLANVGASVGKGSSMSPLPAEAIFTAFRDVCTATQESDFTIVEKRLAQKIDRFLKRCFSKEPGQLTCDTPFCHAGLTMVAIDLAGEIYPCGCAGTGEKFARYSMGNVARLTAPFELDALVAFHAKNAKYETVCQNCRARFLCEHGCPAFDLQDSAFSANVCKANLRLHDHFINHMEVLDSWRKFLAVGGGI